MTMGRGGEGALSTVPYIYIYIYTYMFTYQSIKFAISMIQAMRKDSALNFFG